MSRLSDYNGKAVEQDKLEEKIRKKTAEDILTALYVLCKERKEIQWDDIWFLVMRYDLKTKF